mgnify:CR=1 FL=1
MRARRCSRAAHTLTPSTLRRVRFCTSTTCLSTCGQRPPLLREGAVLVVAGDGTDHEPAWATLVAVLPARAAGTRVAIELVARDDPADGDATAHQVLVESATELLDLAHRVAAQLFPGTALATIPTGLSGALLIHPTVLAALAPRTPLPLSPITEAPIEGVRRLLARAA